MRLYGYAVVRLCGMWRDSYRQTSKRSDHQTSKRSDLRPLTLDL